MRCSRCKAAFLVPHPSAGEAEALDEVVAEATDPRAAPGSGSTHDLFGAGDRDFGDTLTNTRPPASSSDDELWEFEDAAPRSKPAPARPSPQARPESAALGVPVQVQQPSPDPRPAPDLELDLGQAGLDPTKVPDPNMNPAPAPPAANLGDEGFGDLGNPEDWDFLADSSATLAEAATFTDEATAAQPPAPVAVGEAPAARVRIADAVPTAGRARASQRVSSAVRSEPGRVTSARPRIRASLAAAARAVGWAISAVLLVVGFAQALLPSLPTGPVAVEPRVFPLELGEAKNVRGRFIDNAWAGPVFVVEGHYEPSLLPSGPMDLALRWLDGEGRPIADTAPAVAGAGLDAGALRELSPDAAAAILRRSGVNLEFGGSFAVVFEAVPEGAMDFDLVLRSAAAPPASVSEGTGAGVRAAE